MNTPATEAVLKLFAATPASGAMPTVAAVQDSAGTVKLAADVVADPAVTAVWYPANVRERAAAAMTRPIAGSSLVGRGATPRLATLPAGPRAPWWITALPPPEALAAVIVNMQSAPPAAAAPPARARKPFIRRPLPFRCSWPTRRSACWYGPSWPPLPGSGGGRPDVMRRVSVRCPGGLGRCPAG